MRTFWIWLFFLAISWLLAMYPVLQQPEPVHLSWRLGSSALFFTAFFMVPLFRDRSALLFASLLLAAMCSILSLWPANASTAAPDPYSLLVYSIIAGKAAYRLPPIYASIVGLFLFTGACLSSWLGSNSLSPLFLALYAAMLAIGLVLFRIIWKRDEETSARNEALLSEYRTMKRRLIKDEQAARQEERAQVGRDIHDSVGHKLTALIMQLELHRIQTDNDNTAEVLKGLKTLAKDSLEETRSAVKALKQQETGGLPAILGLLRRLESESFMRVHLTARHGALTAPLNTKQSVAVYRAVQESMTNAMKHGSTREVHIMFEAPGGSIFRFEVVNHCRQLKDCYQEGYGLQSMRERMEGAGGHLEVNCYNSQFVVSGTLTISPNIIKEGYYDTNSAGGRSGDGSSRLENDDRMR